MANLKPINSETLLKEQLKNEEFRLEYEKMKKEFQWIRKKILGQYADIGNKQNQG